jgi:hypothetical protein
VPATPNTQSRRSHLFSDASLPAVETADSGRRAAASALTSIFITSYEDRNWFYTR